MLLWRGYHTYIFVVAFPVGIFHTVMWFCPCMHWGPRVPASLICHMLKGWQHFSRNIWGYIFSLLVALHTLLKKAPTVLIDYLFILYHFILSNLWAAGLISTKSSRPNVRTSELRMETKNWEQSLKRHEKAGKGCKSENQYFLPTEAKDTDDFMQPWLQHSCQFFICSIICCLLIGFYIGGIEIPSIQYEIVKSHSTEVTLITWPWYFS